MAVAVVLKHPRRHLLRRAWNQLVAFWGGTLVFVGLLAAVAAFSATLLIILYFVSSGDDSAAAEEPAAADELWSGVGIKEVLLAWVISTLIATVCISVGMRLVRGERRLVLFLRRFGNDDATRAVTFAAAKTVGGSWRLVTLDDERIAALGISAVTLRLYNAGRRAVANVPRLLEVIWKWVVPITFAALVAVLGLVLLRAPDWRSALDDGTFDPYVDTLESIVKPGFPVDAIGWGLPAVFALLVVILTLELVVGVVLFGLMLLAIPLFPLFLFLSSAADAAKRAEEAKTQAIHVKKEISPATYSVVQASRNVFAPRLIVVRVANPVWRQTVRGFAGVCSAPLIDLSDVSENVLWEIEELTHRFGHRCLLVGRHDRVAWLADPPAVRAGSTEERLLQLLDGHEVLAYTTDWRGIRRFARSLRARLLTVTG